MMKRIMVIGCCGAGKSTFSKALHEKTQIPLFQLDQYYWKPNWTETPPEEWKQTVTELAQKDKWIIDGNYGGTMDIRLKRADTVIYLDVSTATAIFRMLKRTIKYYGETRPDMPEKCPERFDWPFFNYVLNFNKTRKQKILDKIHGQADSKAIYILQSNKAIQGFFENI